ncbi:serine hydrolase [Micromonospora sp. NPDC049559]|uniref:serine hydrolase n=1 Tax=Micromonospora sp. NPDC049559 TaxID=3155923 RepID=UPI003419F618
MDLLTLLDPLMTSPLLYPLLAGLGSLDGVLPMIPSEAAILTAGVFAHTGAPSLLLVVVATALGVFIGDHLAYGLSRSVLGPRLINRSKYARRAVAVAGRQLDRRAGLLIVTSRFLPGGRVTMNAACGTARVPLSRFSPASAIAALAWAAYMAGLGYLGGAAFVENPLLGLAVGLALSFACGGIVELVRRWTARRAPRAAGAADPGRGRSPAAASRGQVGSRRVRRALVSATAAVAVLAAPAAAAATPKEADRVGMRSRLDDVVATGAVGALAEVRDEHGAWRATSGVAELGRTRAVPAGGRFRVGSITKTFVATVVLQLVAEGRLGLDDPVETWLPGVVPNGRRITVRHLLDHTSGLYDVVETLPMPPGPEFLDNRWRTWTATELVARALANPPTFEPPGSAYAYSNTGYLLLGQIIEKVTGRSYGDEIERRIIRPLGLTGTSLPGTWPRISGPHPHGYLPTLRDGETHLIDYTEMNPSMMGAAGEMISTTRDLNRFFAALLGGRLLPGHLLDEMRTPGVRGASYGLGLDWWDTSCGIRVYGNDGDALAYRSWSYSTEDLRRQVTVAVTPDFRGDPDHVVDAFLDQAFCG